MLIVHQPTVWPPSEENQMMEGQTFHMVPGNYTGLRSQRPPIVSYNDGV